MPQAPIRADGASAARRYGLAVALSGVTLVVRLSLSPQLDDTAPLLLFILPITFSAWYGGPRVGLFTTALCSLLGVYFVLPPAGSLAIGSPEDVVRLIILMIGGVWASLMFDAFRLARRRIDASARLLANSQAHLSGIIDTAIDAIITVDAQGDILLFNASAERVFGYRADEVLSRPLARLIPALLADLPGHFAGALAVPEHDGCVEPAAGARIGAWLLSARRNSGEEFPVEASIARFTVEGKQFATLIMRDVSERRQIEEQRRVLELKLREAQRVESLGILTGGVAHDFNNLLGGILGNAELALEDLPPGAPGREEIEQIEQIARRAATLTKQMLAYSGGGHFVVSQIDLGALVAEMLPLLESSIPHTATLSWERSAQVLMIEADAVQIRQALTNLVVNAAEALGDQPGRIAISLSAAEQLSAHVLHVSPKIPAGPYVVLTISDTGSGIAPEHLGRIFEPFYSTKFIGRGLGLAAVLGIVLGHRAALSVVSGPGEGTAISLHFPRAAEQSEDRQQVMREAAAPRAHLLLVIDDEEGVRAIVRRMLESDGMTVLVAEDGYQGVELFRQHAAAIDGVLLDMTMPRMSGRDTWNQIRDMRSDVPIMLISGYSADEISVMLPSADLTIMLQKPFSAIALRATVRRALEIAD